MLICVKKPYIASGTTYALFTAEDTTNIAVTSGRVSIDAMVDQGSLKTYSLGNEQVNGGFQNGGTAKFDEKSNLSLNLLTPGDSATFNIKTANYSNINIKYRIKMVAEGDLVPGLKLKAKIGEVEYNFIDSITNWTSLAANALIPDIQVSVELPLEAGNEYQEKTAKLSFVVEAVQGNADVLDPVTHEEGTNDYYVNSEDGMMFMKGIIEKTPHSKANKLNFFLTTDVDMEGYNWNALKLENINFDGQGHTISNLTVEGTDRVALFSQIYGSTVENVVLDGAEISGNHYVGGIVGYQLSGTVSNCEVKNSVIKATPNKVGDSFDNGDKVGGVVGLLYLGADATVRLEGCKVDNVEIHGYRDIGGIVGAANQAVVTNNTVKGNINLHIDQVTNSYGAQAENAGAIVGRLSTSGVEMGAGNDSSAAIVNITRTLPAGKANAETALEGSLNDVKGNVELVVANNAEVTWTTGAGIGSTPFTNTGDVTLIGSEGSKFVALGKGVGTVRASEGNTLTMKGLTIVDESVSYAEGSWEYGYLEFGGKLVFENCVFENAIMLEDAADATFINCTFNSHKDNEYAVWVADGSAKFVNCKFEGARGLKMHEAYGSEVVKVVVEGCEFGPLTKKPGIAMGDLNAATVVEVKDSTFNGCQAGDQGLFIYETDTDVNSFTFVNSGNIVK